VTFQIFGHTNISATHNTTIEFTKDSDLSIKGDCILGVKADFDMSELCELVRKYSKLKISIKVGEFTDIITAKSNSGFCDKNEIVIRKTDFASSRTLAINADKAAIDISRDLVRILQNPDSSGLVEIAGI
jgi:hypothetical protein